MTRNFRRRTMLSLLALGATLVPGQNAPTKPTGTKPIAVGLVWSSQAEGRLADGAVLAADEINRDGGVLGRPIELVRAEIDPTILDPRSASAQLARKLCERGDLLAVIGHHNVEEAIPAAISYDQHGVIFINPTITARTLNDCGFQRTFTTIPTDIMIAQQVATFAFSLGYRRFSVLRSREDFAQDATTAFADYVARLGMTIVDEHSFTARHANFQDIVSDLGAQQFDAILIAARTPQAIGLIRQSFALRLEVPFMIGGISSLHALAAGAEGSTAPIALPILFNPKSEFGPAVAFRESFQSRYAEQPDDRAAQGYDAVRLLAAAIQAANQVDAGAVATVMRYALSWKGVTGRHSFDRNGRVYTKQLSFAIIDKGEIRYDDVDQQQS